jgi:nitroreductase
MEFVDVVARRRMIRDFAPDPITPTIVDGLVDRARRGPSAGNSQAVAFVVLSGPTETAQYWDATLPAERRAGFRWPGLLAAPVLIVVACSPQIYVARYGEPDKAQTGLGAGPDAWPVPYWWVDAGAAVQTLLLGAVDAGLGSCLFGPFAHEAAVRDALGMPDEWRVVGTVALGRPASREPGPSALRPRRAREEVVHQGRW